MKGEQPDMKGCGAGRGADCCIYLTASPSGICCERGGELHNTLVAKQPEMNARRMPGIGEQPYPTCMIFLEESDDG